MHVTWVHFDLSIAWLPSFSCRLAWRAGVCVCVCICIHQPTHPPACLPTYLPASLHTFVCTYAFMHACMHLCMDVDTVDMYAHAHASIWAWLCCFVTGERSASFGGA